jgi:hypothetical protein
MSMPFCHHACYKYLEILLKGLAGRMAELLWWALASSPRTRCGSDNADYTSYLHRARCVIIVKVMIVLTIFRLQQNYLRQSDCSFICSFAQTIPVCPTLSPKSCRCGDTICVACLADGEWMNAVGRVVWGRSAPVELDFSCHCKWPRKDWYSCTCGNADNGDSDCKNIK